MKVWITFKKYFITSIACLFLLAGCSRLSTPNASHSYEIKTPAARQLALSKIQYWYITGALGVKKTGYWPVIVTYTWQQFNGGYRIHIVSALSLYQVAIFGAKNTVTLWKNDTHFMSARTPEGLMTKAMGWSLPLHALQYWIKGMPAPQKRGTFKVRYDAFGHLIGLAQDGWIIYFGAYKTIGNVDLPQTIILNHVDFSAKIVIKQWRLVMQPDVRSQALL